ncbi:MAG: twin-arginine translocation signal domain-containing protein [Phycisphaerales bacterium]|nr:MAG: twin-arginine translocation signal domain-containing protein [Phycisphaerales bacterium]
MEPTSRRQFVKTAAAASVMAFASGHGPIDALLAGASAAEGLIATFENVRPGQSRELVLGP